MKILKNRLVIGCICIIAAFAIGFIAVPKITDLLNDKVTVVVLSKEIKKGEVISADKLRTIQMSLGDIPYESGQYYNCIDTSNGGQTNNRILLKDNSNQPRVLYATTDMYVNDVVTNSKISSSYPYRDEYMRSLGENEYAVTVSVSSLAASLGAKVMAGDIVSLLICDKESVIANVPAELMYVEVLSLVNSDAAEINGSNDSSENGVPSVVTFKANLYQAQLLAGFDKNATIHLALACRGDAVKAKELLKKQEQYFVDNNLLYKDTWFYMEDMEVVEGMEEAE